MFERIKFSGETAKAIEEGEEYFNFDDVSVHYKDLGKRINEKYRSGGKERMEHERPKSLEEIEYIGLVSGFLGEERRKLGLEETYVSELEYVHLFENNAVKLGETPLTVDGDTSRGKYDIAKDASYSQSPAKGSEVSPYAFFSTTSHEEIHRSSALTADPEVGKLFTGLGWYDPAHDTGVGLNEGMTELINQKFIKENRDVLIERYSSGSENDTKMWTENGFRPYKAEMATIENFTREIDARCDNTEGETMDDMCRFYYTRNEKHLETFLKKVTEEEWVVLNLMSSSFAFDLERLKKDTNNEKEIVVKGLIETIVEKYFSYKDEKQKESLFKVITDYANPESVQYLKDTYNRITSKS